MRIQSFIIVPTYGQMELQAVVLCGTTLCNVQAADCNYCTDSVSHSFSLPAALPSGISEWSRPVKHWSKSLSQNGPVHRQNSLNVDGNRSIGANGILLRDDTKTLKWEVGRITV